MTDPETTVPIGHEDSFHPARAWFARSVGGRTRGHRSTVHRDRSIHDLPGTSRAPVSALSAPCGRGRGLGDPFGFEVTAERGSGPLEVPGVVVDQGSAQREPALHDLLRDQGARRGALTDQGSYRGLVRRVQRVAETGLTSGGFEHVAVGPVLRGGDLGSQLRGQLQAPLVRFADQRARSESQQALADQQSLGTGTDDQAGLLRSHAAVPDGPLGHREGFHAHQAARRTIPRGPSRRTRRARRRTRTTGRLIPTMPRFSHAEVRPVRHQVQRRQQ